MNSFHDQETDTPDEEEATFDWVVWIQWVLACTVGWLVGWGLLGQLSLGLTIGLGQWLVLRRQYPGQAPGWWILASTVGWLASWAVIVSGLLIPPNPGSVETLLASTVIGAIMGVAQWLVLRRLVYRAGWWVMASVVGWVVALSGVLGSTVVGAVLGVLTGFMLDLLSRYPRSQ